MGEGEGLGEGEGDGLGETVGTGDGLLFAAIGCASCWFLSSKYNMPMPKITTAIVEMKRMLLVL